MTTTGKRGQGGGSRGATEATAPTVFVGGPGEGAATLTP